MRKILTFSRNGEVTVHDKPISFKEKREAFTIVLIESIGNFGSEGFAITVEKERAPLMEDSERKKDRVCPVCGAKDMVCGH